MAIKTKKTTSKKKPTAKKKEIVVENKDDKVKKQVEDLLKDVIPDMTTKKNDEVIESNGSGDKLDDAVEEKGNDWLKEQLDDAVEKNKILRVENEKLKDNYKKIFNEFENLKNNKPLLSSDDELKKSLRIIYDEFHNNLTGNNKEKIRWVDVKVDFILHRLHTSFPFLR